MPAAKALGVGVMRDFRATNICAKKMKKAKIFPMLFNGVNKRSSLCLSREGKDWAFIIHIWPRERLIHMLRY